MFCEAVKAENHRNDHDHERDHQPRKFFDALVERGFDQLAGQAAGHFAEIGLRAGGDDDARGRTALDARAEKTQVCVLDALDGGTRIAHVGFFHGQRFAGKRGLDDEQIFRRDQAHVTGNHVAGGKFHDVAGHEIFERNFLRLAIAQRGGGDLDHRLEFRGGGVGLGFLHEPQQQAEQHHQHHQGAADVIAGFIRRRERDDGQQRKQNHQRVERRDPQPPEPGMFFFLRDFVGAVLQQTSFDLRFGKASGGGVEFLQDGGGFLHRGLSQDIGGGLLVRTV